MNVHNRTIIGVLCGLVLLLLGVIAGQNLERSRGIRPELPLVANPAPVQSVPPQAAPALSPTEYWISTTEMDAGRLGFSSWVVLRPGGSFLVERCKAPDYAMAERSGVAPELPLPACETLIDGSTAQMSEKQLVVRSRDGSLRTFGFTLAKRGATESLFLDLERRVELVPGSKNDLYQRLQRIPADEPARKRILQRMFAGAAPQSTPGSRVP